MLSLDFECVWWNNYNLKIVCILNTLHYVYDVVTKLLEPQPIYYVTSLTDDP